MPMPSSPETDAFAPAEETHLAIGIAHPGGEDPADWEDVGFATAATFAGEFTPDGTKPTVTNDVYSMPNRSCVAAGPR
jgi:hypothetical protein